MKDAYVKSSEGVGRVRGIRPRGDVCPGRYRVPPPPFPKSPLLTSGYGRGFSGVCGAWGVEQRARCVWRRDDGGCRGVGVSQFAYVDRQAVEPRRGGRVGWAAVDDRDDGKMEGPSGAALLPEDVSFVEERGEFVVEVGRHVGSRRPSNRPRWGRGGHRRGETKRRRRGAP